jgi:peptidoglycan/xylan/chitin deacetylase (PgdA/CDA1 family)
MLLVPALLLLQAAAPPRTMAVTFDDLPVISVVPASEAERDTTTTRLLDAIRKHAVPAAGFVNENKLFDSAGALVPARVSYLRRWISAGLELGNHTWSHPDLHQVTLRDFEDEIIRGEAVTRQLMTQAGKTPRYFRHPFLHTGRSLAVRDSLNQFLAEHGYRVAPVTIDNSDYVYAAAYDRARADGDAALALRIRREFLGYMDTVTAFYQHQSQAILGRELPQILLLHANRLNADTFDELAGMLERKGYRFVTLDAALEDPAYQSADRYAGPAGITWLHRWAITAGMPGATFRGEPDVAAWVSNVAQGRSSTTN